MKILISLLICTGMVMAQQPSPAPPPPVKMCKTWDIESSRFMEVPCPPQQHGKFHRAVVKFHKTMKVTGEVGLGVVIFAAWLYGSGHV